MKKVLIAAVLTFSAFVSQAQSYRYHPSGDGSGVRFGLKAGVNFANVIVSPRPGNLVNGRTDFHAGLFAEIPITEKVSFQPEVLYSRQGFKVVDGFGNVTMNMINVPLLLKLHVTPAVSFVAGPQVSYLANARIGLNNWFAVNYNDAFRRTGIDGVAGLEFETGDFVIGGRYSYGFSNMNKDFSFTDNMSLNDIFQLRNSTVQLSVGYKF
jgi:hypothetical protein